MFIDVIKDRVSSLIDLLHSSKRATSQADLAAAKKELAHHLPSRTALKLAQCLPSVGCFKIDALIAFRDYLKERDSLEQHFESVKTYLCQHEAELGELLQWPIWLEWVRPQPHGFLCAPLEESDTVNFIRRNPNRNFMFAFFCFRVNEETDDIEVIIRVEDDNGNFYNLNEDGTVHEALDDFSWFHELVIHTNFFRLNPAIAQLTTNPAQGGQEERAERQNNRGTKIIKAARSKVQMIVIDGVKRVVNNGVVKFRIHARGWHMRRHDVREHWRHLASGRVVRVNAHQRGDEKLGWIIHVPKPEPREKRYEIKPAAAFFPGVKSGFGSVPQGDRQ